MSSCKEGLDLADLDWIRELVGLHHDLGNDGIACHRDDSTVVGRPEQGFDEFEVIGVLVEEIHEDIGVEVDTLARHGIEHVGHRSQVARSRSRDSATSLAVCPHNPLPTPAYCSRESPSLRCSEGVIVMTPFTYWMSKVVPGSMPAARAMARGIVTWFFSRTVTTVIDFLHNFLIF